MESGEGESLGRKIGDLEERRGTRNLCVSPYPGKLPRDGSYEDEMEERLRIDIRFCLGLQ